MKENIEKAILGLLHTVEIMEHFPIDAYIDVELILAKTAEDILTGRECDIDAHIEEAYEKLLDLKLKTARGADDIRCCSICDIERLGS